MTIDNDPFAKYSSAAPSSGPVSDNAADPFAKYTSGAAATSAPASPLDWKDYARSFEQGATFGFGDETNALARSVFNGEKYDDALKDERERLSQVRAQHPYVSGGLELAGGLASTLGGGELLGAAGMLGEAAAPASTLGRAWQGAKLGAGAGAVYGAGATEPTSDDLAEAAKQRLAGAYEGAKAGAFTGAILPAGASAVTGAARKLYEAVSPTAARGAAYLTGAAPEEAAANRVIANQLSAAGVSPQELADRLSAQDRSARFYSNSQAADTLAPVDLDPTLQRLAGSTARSSEDASNYASQFLYGRQTGLTPRAGELPPEAGIATRPAFSQVQAGAAPMGQSERILDALKRAFLIKDEDFHGMGPTAYRTEQQILEKAKTDADVNYSAAFDAAKSTDLRPVLQPIIQKWSTGMVDEPQAVASQLKSAIAQFRTPSGDVVNSLPRFDRAKQYLDGVIQNLYESPEGRNRYMAGRLGQFQAEMLSAIDNIQVNNIGPLYNTARGAFGSQMQMKDALDWGRSALKENTEATADQFNAMTDGQQKLARLGVLDDFNRMIQGKKRTADATALFDSPRVQDLLTNMIPRSQRSTAEFADRPERFGQYLANEQAQAGTQRAVFGGSDTARKFADDAAFTRETLGSMFEKWRSTPSLLHLGMEAVSAGLNKFFGYRADTASAIVRKLFTADPATRTQTIADLQRTLGNDRFGGLVRFINQQSPRIGAAASQLAIPAQQSAPQLPFKSGGAVATALPTIRFQT